MKHIVETINSTTMKDMYNKLNALISSYEKYDEVMDIELQFTSTQKWGHVNHFVIMLIKLA